MVTYSQDDAGATFLRREEFRAVSCECTLRLPTRSEGGLAADDLGRLLTTPKANSFPSPTARAPITSKASFATSVAAITMMAAPERRRPGDPGRSLYNPFRIQSDYYAGSALWRAITSTMTGTDSGDLTLADSDGDTYVEACRMIRKDGFWRIAQDLRQEGLNAFPADYLDERDEVDEYSDYVTDAVSAYEASHWHRRMITKPVRRSDPARKPCHLLVLSGQHVSALRPRFAS